VCAVQVNAVTKAPGGRAPALNAAADSDAVVAAARWLAAPGGQLAGVVGEVDADIIAAVALGCDARAGRNPHQFGCVAH
jgi:hypothetical protein